MQMQGFVQNVQQTIQKSNILVQMAKKKKSDMMSKQTKPGKTRTLGQ